MQRFLQTFKTLNSSNLHLLESIYSKDIEFSDPAHRIIGIEKLTTYFEVLYQNINTIDFAFDHPLQKDDIAYVQWLMTFSHTRLKDGKEIAVPGMSFLKFDPSGKVSFHRDQFDLGCLLYEHLPIIGRLIASAKRRLGS